MILPRDLQLTPQNWSASDRGGMKQASISASGSGESLAYLLSRLGDRVEIYNDMGDPVWWGTLWDLEITLGNVVVSMSLDDVYNRVAVIYPFRKEDGSEESRTTTWVEDADSIERFGVRELLYGMSVAFSDSAVIARDQILARYAFPAPVISTQSNTDFGARLTAMGNWYKLDSVYYRNIDGLVEHQGGGASQIIGRYIKSNGIGFAAGTGQTGKTGADDMWDTNGKFVDLIRGDTITISGANIPALQDAPNNNGTFTVGEKTANYIETEEASFVDENPGLTIKVSWGDGVAMDNVAQQFRLVEAGVGQEAQTNWVATHIAIQIRRVGTGTFDSIRVALYADNAGVPGTILSTNETPGSALSTELTWTEFVLDVPFGLIPGFPYWIGIRRTNYMVDNLANGYEVAVDENLGYTQGAMLVYDGANWWPRAVDADLAFRVIGEITSTEQMVKALEHSAVFLQTLVQLDSAVPIRQYMSTENTALSVVEQMIDAGTNIGFRLISWVTFDNSVLVNVPILAEGNNLILGQDGKIRYASGAYYPPGKLVFGQPVAMDSLLLLDSIGIRGARGAATYIQESEYDAALDRITVQGEGVTDPWAALKIRKG